MKERGIQKCSRATADASAVAVKGAPPPRPATPRRVPAGARRFASGSPGLASLQMRPDTGVLGGALHRTRLVIWNVFEVEERQSALRACLGPGRSEPTGRRCRRLRMAEAGVSVAGPAGRAAGQPRCALRRRGRRAHRETGCRPRRRCAVQLGRRVLSPSVTLADGRTCRTPRAHLASARRIADLGGCDRGLIVRSRAPEGCPAAPEPRGPSFPDR